MRHARIRPQHTDTFSAASWNSAPQMLRCANTGTNPSPMLLHPLCASRAAARDTRTQVAQARGERAVSKRRLTRAYTVALRVTVPLQ
jgi:hypothetical protein